MIGCGKCASIIVLVQISSGDIMLTRDDFREIDVRGREKWRSGTVKAANGEAVLPIVVVGRIDVGGAVEVEVVGVGAVRIRGR